MNIETKTAFLILLTNAIILSACMHDRDNPHDTSADNNYYYGIPEISIRQDAVIIPNNGLFEADDTEIQNYIDIDFLIENTGTAYLFMENMQVSQSNMFSIVKMPVTPVDPGKGSGFTVRFAPTATGEHYITIIINYYDADDEPAVFSFTLAGTGVN